MKNYERIIQLFGIVCVLVGFIGVLAILGILISKISILLLIGYLCVVLFMIGAFILSN